VSSFPFFFFSSVLVMGPPSQSLYSLSFYLLYWHTLSTRVYFPLNNKKTV
jgi:hypothetical protein